MIGNVNVPGALAADIANKVDKVIGKGLSTNDFTDAYKTQLDNISQSGGTGTNPTIVCSMTQPQDLKNGLWIKTDSEKDIRIIPFKGNLYKEKMECMTARKVFDTNGICCETINGKIYVFCNADISCYDLETKEWTTMNSKLYNENSYDARAYGNYVCSCVINNKIYLFGGTNYGTRTVQCYDPETDTIDSYLNKLNVRASYACCCVINGKAYIFGGYDYSNGNTNTIQSYDPETNTCTTMNATCPDTYTSEMTCCVYNNKAYIFGGCQPSSSRSSTSRAFCYDPAVDKVTTIARLYSYDSNNDTKNSYYAISSFLWNNKIYLFGGCYYYSSSEYCNNHGKYYDPETNTYTDSDLCIPISIGTGTYYQYTLLRSCHCIVNDKLYIFGGSLVQHNVAYRSGNYNNYGYIYDLNTLLPMGSLPFSTSYSRGNYCAIGDNIYILDTTLGTNVWYYNTTTNTLHKKENQLLAAPIHYTSKCLLNNKIYFLGSSSPYKLYCYDPINETCEELCQIPNNSYNSIIGVNNEIFLFSLTAHKVDTYNILTKTYTEKYYSNNNKLFASISSISYYISAFVYCNKVYFSCVKLTTNTGNNTSVNSQAIAIYNIETNSMDYQIIGDCSKISLSDSACRIYNKLYIFANTMRFTSSSNNTITEYGIFSYDLESGEFNQLPDFTTTVKDELKCGNVVSCAVGESIYLFGGDDNAIQKLTVTLSNDSMKNNINIITTNLDMNSVALRSPQEGVYEYKNILNVVDMDNNMNVSNLEFHPIENYQVIDQES